MRAHGLVCLCNLIEESEVSNAMTTNYSEELDFRLIFGESSYTHQSSLGHTGLFITFRARDDFNAPIIINEVRASARGYNGSDAFVSRLSLSLCGQNVLQKWPCFDLCVTNL